jgi:hypothetical protein
MLTITNESGRKKMLTKVSSLIFSPSWVEARLSITALALKSYKCRGKYMLSCKRPLRTYTIS